ncbi:molecular chaperone DnaJ [Actinosynnema sp. ALI-1.44]|uniref:J domain-containing protein n=1 Tax=Actinosynnema sp. ALI-1.44 TaxID=1933779 RepID=UPI00097C5DAF|nr:DnaJ domain-containing protein [Actinosynnema sp. ALI-1.44]ONI79522.1 molecular chaperone DnaJ [Actinosynnema sp. ALI-1.44]
MQHVDYYELLGVDENATAGEIRSAYRALAKVMHPDAGGTAGTFRLLREAYETLSDPQLRAYYDSEGDEEEAEEPAPAPVRRVARKIVRDDPNYVPAQAEIPAETIPWWHTVTSTRAVMSPPIRPEPPVLAAAVAAWVILLLALVLVAPPVPLLVIWLLAMAASGAVLVKSVRRHLDVRTANRAFLARFGVKQIFGAPGVGTDHRAERLTANLLATYLTRLPAARIFHGIAEPGSVFADVDHAVLCGRRLVLIESKMWLPGHYDVDEDGEVWRNDHPFRGGTIQLADQIAEFRALWPDLEVRGVLLLYPSRPGDITTDQTGAVIPPMVPGDFVREIGAWLAADPVTVDKKAFTEVLAQLAH